MNSLFLPLSSLENFEIPSCRFLQSENKFFEIIYIYMYNNYCIRTFLNSLYTLNSFLLYTYIGYKLNTLHVTNRLFKISKLLIIIILFAQNIFIGLKCTNSNRKNSQISKRIKIYASNTDIFILRARASCILYA